jgi:phosphonate degradation associated HDIG domain protein
MAIVPGIGSDALTEHLLQLLRERGGAAYLGEPVTQFEHALQTAVIAEAAGASDALVIAALLHDIGHLLGPGEHAAPGRDPRHEDLGNQWLANHFGSAVTEPIRMHVAAKRYLCATEPGYAESLSFASAESLVAQGGPMTALEVRKFVQTPWAREAARLRRWDDAAKVPGLALPDPARYRNRIKRLLEYSS